MSQHLSGSLEKVIPTPSSGESEDDFVARCIPVVIGEESVDQDQASAICFTQFEEKSITKQRIPTNTLEDFISKFEDQDNELRNVLHNVTIFNATVVDTGANEFPSSIVKMFKKNKNTEGFKKEITHITNVSKAKDGNVEMDGLLIVANRVDAHGDLFLTEDIKIASDRFMQEGRTPLVDVQHDNVFGKAFISELYIVKGNDPLFDKDGSGDLVGSLAARIRITDDGIKQKALRGELQGFSIFGESEVQIIKQKSIKKLSMSKKLSIGFDKLMADVFGITKQKGELTMAEVQDILDALSLMSEKLDALAPEEAPEDDGSEEMEEGLEKSDEQAELEKSLETVNAEKDTLLKAKADVETEKEVLETENTELKEKVSTLEKGLKETKDSFKEMEKQVRDLGKNNGQDKTSSDKENKVFLFGR